MWRNYMTVALRALTADRTYAFINVFGLAIGFAACALLLLYVRYERSYDGWLPDSDRIYQVQATWHEPGQPVTRSQNSPFPLHDTLAAGFADIDALTVVSHGRTVVSHDGQPLFVDAATVDPSFFDIFRLPFAHGAAAGALPDTNSVVLTEREAIRQFGTSDAVGRTLTLGAGEDQHDYRVSAVLRDLPANSNLRLAIIFRYNPAEVDAMPPAQRGWGNMNQQHYVRLRPGADAAAINAAFPAWEHRVVAPQIIDGRPVSQADIMDLKLVPITGVHLGDAQLGALTPGGNPRALATFALVALLTLGMAAMNFVNLATARATRRAREVALRKVLGATRGQLIVQMLGESLLTTGIAMLLALGLVELVAPVIGAWVDADLQVHYLGSGGMLLPALGLYLATGLLGGLYPAFYLSRFRPSDMLHPGKAATETPGTGRLRTSLVVIQFAIAIGLITCTSIIYLQTRYVETVDPGYRRDGLIEIDSARRLAGDNNEFQAARQELLRVPGVVGAGRTNLGLAATNRHIMAVRAADGRSLSIGVYAVDPDFFGTMQIPLVAGRLLGDRYANDRVIRPEATATGQAAQFDTQRAINVVVNRNAAQLMGFASPEAAIGKTIRVGIEGEELTPATIVGVVEDTRIRTARDAIEPLIYAYDPARTGEVIVRYAAARPAEVMAGLNRVWRRFEPDVPFEAAFAESLVAESYTAERVRGALAGFASAIACSACSGWPPSPPSGGPRRSASARCSARASATSSGCSCGNSPSRCARQSGRLAGGLVGDARLAQQLRLRIGSGPGPSCSPACSR
jgi:putative ABC transport system permease protein